jgi:3-oxoacyl-[acyl-carrier protein] reductase
VNLGLHDRVALVTGGASGIGAAVVRALADEGAAVAVVDSAAADCALALAYEADVRDVARAQAVVDDIASRLGGLDILVCCAGIARDAISWKMTESDWDDVLDTNLKGCFAYARAALPVLRLRGGGRIVNIASINGLRGKAGQANYAASKAGVIGLSKALAREAGRFDVTVNVVAPGFVDTAMTRSLGEDVREAAVRESALGRVSSPEDVAAVVAFLCSAGARQVTGEVIRVDAGQYI